jgi:hypothetical protein
MYTILLLLLLINNIRCKRMIYNNPKECEYYDKYSEKDTDMCIWFSHGSLQNLEIGCFC